MSQNPKVQLQYFLFEEHTIPKGRLPNDKRAQACWYFYTLAQKQKEKVGDSIDDQFGLLETDEWMDKRYEQTARTVAMIYQLESPDDFLKFFGYVKQEAKRLGYPEPAPEYMRPLRLIRIH